MMNEEVQPRSREMRGKAAGEAETGGKQTKDHQECGDAPESAA